MDVNLLSSFLRNNMINNIGSMTSYVSIVNTYHNILFYSNEVEILF